MQNQIISRSENLMGTTITISAVKQPHISTVEITDAIEHGLSEFRRIVKLYTRFNDTSELAELNRSGGKWHKVSEEFFMLIERMLEISKITKGAFDPTIIDFLEVYGYDKNYDFSKLDNPKLDSMVESIAKNRHSWQEIELDKEKLQVKLCKNQRLDLGGIGKGYAIDCAAKHLQNVGNFLIDGGGDIYAQGKNADKENWLVDLKHKDGVFGQVRLRESGEALACSGSWARKVKQFHHLINPNSGKSDAKYETVFVLSSSATTADVWGTALAVGGKDLMLSLQNTDSENSKNNPNHVKDANAHKHDTYSADPIDFLAIDSENKVIGTKSFRERI